MKRDEKNDDDDDDEVHCHSWISPSYKPPERIHDIKDPEILELRNLLRLRLQKSTEIMENATSQNNSFKCCCCNNEMSEDDKPNILSPCGHLVCNNCKDILMAKDGDNKRCPICDTPISKVQRIFFEKTCALCLENPTNTISLPCGHLCMCYECAMVSIVQCVTNLCLTSNSLLMTMMLKNINYLM